MKFDGTRVIEWKQSVTRRRDRWTDWVKININRPSLILDMRHEQVQHNENFTVKSKYFL